MNVRDSIQYVIEWADKLNIDLEEHIKWKMRYNSLRSQPGEQNVTDTIYLWT